MTCALWFECGNHRRTRSQKLHCRSCFRPSFCRRPASSPHLLRGQGQEYGTAVSSGHEARPHWAPAQPPSQLVETKPCSSLIPGSLSEVELEWAPQAQLPERRDHELANTSSQQQEKTCCFLGSPHCNHPWNVQNGRKAVFSWKHMENSLFAWRKIIACCFFPPGGK